MSNGPVARAEIAMVVHKRDKTGLGEGLGEALEAMLLRSRVAMSQRDGRKLSNSF